MARLLIIVSFIVIISSIAYGSAVYPRMVYNYSNYSFVSSIAVGFDYVYFATTNGIIRYHINDEEWDIPIPKIEGLIDYSIGRIQVSFDDELLWVQTEFGIYEYDFLTDDWDKVESMPPVETQAEHLAPDPHYFAPWGFNYLPGGKIVSDQGRTYQLTDIVNDNWGNLWIGTWGLGPARADATARQIEFINYGLIETDVTSIYKEDGNFWIGGISNSDYRTGITFFDWDDNYFEHIQTETDLIGYGIDVNDISGNEESIFLATMDGIVVIDREEARTTDRMRRKSGLPDDRVLSLHASDDTLFIGTEFGLGILHLDPDTLEQETRMLLSPLAIYSLEQIEDHLWIGTDKGAFRYNLKNNKLGKLEAAEVTASGIIYDIATNGRKVYLATSDELVSIDLRTADIEQYPQVNNYGGIRAVAVSDTIIAAAVYNGLLLIFDGRSKYHRFYDLGDGLISDVIRDITFDGEYIWLGTERGLTRFWYKSPEL